MTRCLSAEYFSIGETPRIFPRRSWGLRHFKPPPPPLGHPPLAIVLYYLFRCHRTAANLHRGTEVRTKEGNDTLLNLPRSAGKVQENIHGGQGDAPLGLPPPLGGSGGHPHIAANVRNTGAGMSPDPPGPFFRSSVIRSLSGYRCGLRYRQYDLPAQWGSGRCFVWT